MEDVLFKRLTDGEKEVCSICDDWGFSASCKGCVLRKTAFLRLLSDVRKKKLLYATITIKRRGKKGEK